MNGPWTFKSGATSINDWVNHGPWTTDVGVPIRPGGSTIDFRVLDDETLYVVITANDSGDINEGPGHYDSDSGVVSAHFHHEGIPYLLVASLAQFTNATGDTEWHLYSLVMKDDPVNVAVVGAQGGG